MRTCRVCGLSNVETETGPPTCQTCRRERYLTAKRLYQQSEKGRATARSREERADVKEKRRLASAAARIPHPKLIQTEGERLENRRLANGRYVQSEKGKAKKRRDYARRQAAIVASRPVTAEDWMEILAQHKNRCHYCGKRRLLTLDHVIPLRKGGLHVKENIVPACRNCNSAKRDKLIRLL